MDLFEFAKGHEAQEPPKKQEDPIYTVSQVTAEIKKILASHFLPKHPITIEGEISNFRGRNSSGHMYFQLKDDASIIPCVFFRYANQKCDIKFQEGSLVQAKGKIEVYERGGRYQFVLESLSEKGKGELFEQFLALKKKLLEEGLFEKAHKQDIPSHPKRIGVVTSSTGSVIKDIIHVIQSRCPHIDVVLFPCQVQGDKAPHAICEQIARAQEDMYKIDTLIVGRGGGSIEDLWAFNDENVARALFSCKIPVISAVGHQTDFSIADFVADMRAATPSQAAELSTPNMLEIQNNMKRTLHSMLGLLQNKLLNRKTQLERWTSSPMLKDPRARVNQRIQNLDELSSRLLQASAQITPMRSSQAASLQRDMIHAQTNRMQKLRSRWEKSDSKLHVLDPTNVLSRGYSIVKTKSNRIVSKTSHVQVQDDVQVVVSDGEIACRVTKV